jgi:hypothetical protein
MSNDGSRGGLASLAWLAAGSLVLVAGAAIAPRIISGICFGPLGLACVAANRELAPAFHPFGKPSDRLGRLAVVLLGALMVAGGIVRLG